MNIKHKKFGEYEFVSPLLQRHLEAYFKKLRDMDIDVMEISIPEYSGGCVRAAIELDLLKPKFDVGESSPDKVRWLAKEIQDIVSGALNIEDPN